MTKEPRMRLQSFALTCLMAGSAGALFGQRATELFIPIGESPDLSGEETVIGTIEELDPSGESVVVRDERSGEEHLATVVEQTEIYLDRSKLNRRNDYGTFDDLSEGARVEMLYAREAGDAGALRWIKVEIANEP